VVAAVTAIGAFVAVTAYGFSNASSLGMGAPDLETAFSKGTNAIVTSLFLPLWKGREVPDPGRLDWAIIIALILVGYRQLEARAFARQAPVLDISQLSDGQPDSPSSNDTGANDAGIAGQRHTLLAAELHFRLTSMEVRTPAILPGGSRPDVVASISENRGLAGGNSRSDGLAAVAEHSGVAAGGLAGSIIRFFGMLWPGPRYWRLRLWIEPLTYGTPSGDAGDIPVTVALDNPQAGVTVATKTMAAASLDEAASMVSGYVTRQVFARDPATPSWCHGAFDGRDLATMLIAQQHRVYADSWDAIRASRQAQVRILLPVTRGRCAGVVRYELAHLHDLGNNHVTALSLHADNREQYPRFFRARYRLAASLEMAANPGLTISNPLALRNMLTEILAVLNRCGLTVSATCPHDGIVASAGDPDRYRISDALSLELLSAARAELRIIRRQFTLPAVLWASLLHRDERTTWRPYWRLRTRQAFRDAVCIAELLVAARIRINPHDNNPEPRRSHYRHGLRVAAAITGDSDPVESLLWSRPARKVKRGRPPQSRLRPAARDQVRLLPWRRQTASWLAVYNAACLYAALAQHGLPVEDRVVTCLQRAGNNHDSEIDRPYDWMSFDPDLLPLKESRRDEYPAFKKFLRERQHKDYPAGLRRVFDPEEQESV
jgi:hypothetical protein